MGTKQIEEIRREERASERAQERERDREKEREMKDVNEPSDVVALTTTVPIPLPLKRKHRGDVGVGGGEATDDLESVEKENFTPEKKVKGGKQADEANAELKTQLSPSQAIPASGKIIKNLAEAQ